MEHATQAQAYFLEGYNCAQSVLLAFAPDLGLTNDEAARMASSFGGGMGRLREVCGALSASFLILGLREGYSSPSDDEAKARQYARVQEIAAQFRAIHGTILCRDLLGYDLADPKQEQAARDSGKLIDYCPTPVLAALDILGELGLEA